MGINEYHVFQLPIQNEYNYIQYNIICIYYIKSIIEKRNFRHSQSKLYLFFKKTLLFSIIYFRKY